MNSNNQLAFYYDDGDYRVYCSICDNLCVERYYKNH